jgi:hypothetical protein
MSVNGKFSDIRRDDLLVLADRFQIANAPTLLAEVKAAVGGWPEFARQAMVSARMTELIKQHLIDI